MLKKAAPKIALINFGGLGDEVLFTPTINAIQHSVPHAKLTLILEDRSMAIASLIDHVDSFIPIGVQSHSRAEVFFQLISLLKQNHFDAVLSSGSSPFIPIMLKLSGVPRRVGYQTGLCSQWFLSAEAPLDQTIYAADMHLSLARTFLGEALVPTLPTLKSPEPQKTQWATKIFGQPVNKKILLHPGVSKVSVTKNIPKRWASQNWASLIQQLAQKQTVYLVGGPDDTDIVGEIRHALPDELPNFQDLYGQTKSIEDLAALIQGCDLFLCLDSGPMHMAVAYQRPVVALFGPTDPKKLLPNHPQYQAVQHATGEVAEITVEAVTNAVQEFLNAR